MPASSAHWVPATKKANLVGLRIHDLRKTAATNLVQAGIDIKSVTEMLGHEDIRTTLQHYAKTTPEVLLKASEALEAAIVGCVTDKVKYGTAIMQHR